ncbi:MAG: TRAM domain-containing protein, partial [Candidatus Acidiferrales bacterium]
SPRPGTPAQNYPDQLPEEEKTRRLMALQARQREIQLRRNERLVGEEVEVLVESRNPKQLQWRGRTTSNRVVNFASSEEKLGSYVRVLVTRAGPNSLVGERVAS